MTDKPTYEQLEAQITKLEAELWVANDRGLRTYDGMTTDYEETISALRGALEFYTDKDHYQIDKNHTKGNYFVEEIVGVETWDIGKLARTTLKELFPGDYE